MKEKVKQIVSEKGFEKWLKRDNLIIVILTGVLLLIIALPVKSDSQKDGVRKEAQNEIQNDAGYVNQGDLSNDIGKENTTGNGQSVSYAAFEAYENSLEIRLKEILEDMSGAGKVKVMITLASSEELVVEKDRPVVRSNTTETDSEGGSRSIYQVDSGEDTVYRTFGTENEPYVIKTLLPKVEGVLVAAQGAANAVVAKNITEAVQVLFDLEAHQVKVIALEMAKD